MWDLQGWLNSTAATTLLLYEITALYVCLPFFESITQELLCIPEHSQLEYAARSAVAKASPSRDDQQDNYL